MRVYGAWSGNPKGIKELSFRCIAEVAAGWHFAQCSRKRGYGLDKLYCKQHAKQVEQGKHVWVPEDK